MASLLRVTAVSDNKSVLVNVDNVTLIKKNGPHTRLYFAGAADDFLDVTESMEAIVAVVGALDA